MMHAAVLSVVLAAGVWPFGGKSNEDATIGGLKPAAEVELRRAVPDGGVKARDHYQEFLALPTAPADMRAESMRRLADLYLVSGEDSDAAGHTAAASEEFSRAIGLYTQYLNEFPGRPQADTVLYSLSRAYEGVGDASRALVILDRLVREYPHSAVLAEAQFRRGERLFVNRDYTAAERAYAAVVAQGTAGEFHEQALYKQGWSRFKLNEYETCLDPFLGVLARRFEGVTPEHGGELLAGMSKAQRELTEDTLRAMSLSVSQLDGLNSIAALLDRRGPVAFADVLYAGLGDLYLTQERFGDAALAYGGFVQREPAHARAPYLQSKVIAAYTAGKFPSKVLDAKAQYVELYGLHSAYWHGVKPTDRPLVVQELKQSLGDLASHDHAHAQKIRTAEAYHKAALWYRRYLEYFPDDPESAQRNFLLAELLHDGGDFESAASEYRRTAYGYAPHPQAAEAGYAAILAATAHEKKLTEPAKSAWHTLQIEEQLKFVAAFPEHAQAASVQTGVAEDLFKRGDLQRAVAVAGEVVVRTPPAAPELDRVAWTVLAHGQFDLGRYPEAEHAYIRLRQFAVADPARRTEIEERIAASVYRQAEAQKAGGNTAAAVAEFLRVADAAPAATIRPQAIYDASALLVADKQWSQAIDVLQRFRREFPQHKFSDDVTRQLAVAYGESGRGIEAAGEFERIAATAGFSADEHREALWGAADLYGKAGRRADEKRMLAAAVQRFPLPFAEAMEGRLRLADIARDTGDIAGRRNWLDAIVAADMSAGANRSDRSRYLAAQATLEIATPLRDAFIAAKLSSPLPKSLKAKKQRMELALAAYARAADYAVADVMTAATFETAELYYQLSRDLLEAEKPAGLSTEEQEEYQLLLEEQAFPFEEKAIELHAANAARTVDGVYDEWVRRSFTRLTALNPARYARNERSEDYVDILD